MTAEMQDERPTTELAWQLPVSPATTFEQACSLVVTYLQTALPMGFWAVTRTENDRQTYLCVADTAYGLQRGGSHSWSESYCVHMTAGTAPQVAPDAQAVPVYAAAGVNAQVAIGAYAGAPIRDADGQLFGALCGLDPHVKPAALAEAKPLLDVLTKMLELVLAADRARDAAALAAQAARTAAVTDSLTGVLNRRGFDELVAQESARHRVYGDPTAVAVIDLDGLKQVNDGPGGHAAGDRHLQDAAAALRRALRTSDPLARVGGDEFAVVLRDTPVRRLRSVRARLTAALDEVGTPGSVGVAGVEALGDVAGAVAAADADMYATKRQRASATA